MATVERLEIQIKTLPAIPQEGGGQQTLRGSICVIANNYSQVQHGLYRQNASSPWPSASAQRRLPARLLVPRPHHCDSAVAHERKTSRKGDHFTASVQSRARYRGAVLTGVMTELKTAEQKGLWIGSPQERGNVVPVRDPYL